MKEIGELELTEPVKLEYDQVGTLLLVDDEANVLKALRRLFYKESYIIYTAASGAEGLELLRQHKIDLIISDMRMPEMTGTEFFTEVVQHWPETVRILLTGYADLQSTIDAVNNGRIYNYCNKPWQDEELKILVRNALEQKCLREERDCLSALVQQQNIVLKEINENLEEKVEQRTEQLGLANESLKKQYIDTIRAFSRIIEMRPGIKSGQSKYIAEKALLVAQELGMNVEEKKAVFYAGLLIQIGKMSLPDKLLEASYYKIPVAHKQNFLKHAVEGEVLLQGLTQLKEASILIRHQYERYNGSGFPDHLVKQAIPLGSRILSVVRDYIAYLEGSITGEVMSVSDAFSQLLIRKGSYYDTDVVDAFVKVINELPAGQEAAEETFVINKSWKTSKLFDRSKKPPERPILEVSLAQLKPGMEIESVYFEGKPYIKSCLVDEKIIQRINSLKENTGKNPVIKILMGKR